MSRVTIGVLVDLDGLEYIGMFVKIDVTRTGSVYGFDRMIA